MTPTDVFHAYYRALTTGDIAGLTELLDENIIWHQPGAGKLSGTYHRRDDVLALFGEFMQLSGGTFRIDRLDDVMANGDLVAATLHFAAEREGREPLSMNGIDLFRVAEGRIAEVWLFSADQTAEDTFWS